MTQITCSLKGKSITMIIQIVVLFKDRAPGGGGGRLKYKSACMCVFGF